MIHADLAVIVLDDYFVEALLHRSVFHKKHCYGEWFEIEGITPVEVQREAEKWARTGHWHQRT